MSVRTPQCVHTPPPRRPAESPLDVLLSGPERSGPPSLRHLAGAVAVLALLGAAVLVSQQPGPGGGPAPRADGVRFSLHPRSAVVPRHVPPAPGRAAVAGLHLELVNTGDAEVLLQEVALIPGRWRVEIADRHQLRPGWSAVLDLSREVDCGLDADHGPAPTELVVRAAVGGRVLVRTVDVGPAQRAYGAELDDVLAAPEVACDLTVASPLPGPIGDLHRPDAEPAQD